MSYSQALPERKGYVTGPILILLTFSSVFFSRLLDTAGAPSLINFVHFLFVPLALYVALTSAKLKNKYQATTVKFLTVGMGILLSVMIVSALLNQAGAINVVLHFLLLGEPYLFLIALISLPVSAQSLQKLKTWLFRFWYINLTLAILQQLIIVPNAYRFLPNTTLFPADLVQGVFFVSGGGHNISSVFTIIVGLYYIKSLPADKLWLKWLVGGAIFWQIIASDSKATLLTFAVSAVMLSLRKVKNVGKFLAYLILAVVCVAGFLWCVHNLEAFRAYRHGLNFSQYTTENRMVRLKLSPLHIIPSHYQSDLNFWLGLGPGHTVSRLGGWMLEKYASFLVPLGATIHPIGSEVWVEIRATIYEGSRAISSFYHPLWGWAGIWGDLGMFGVFAYAGLGLITWVRLCRDDLSRLCILRTAWSGLIMAQIEEPGIMLSIAFVIGLLWHDYRIAQNNTILTKQWQLQKDLFRQRQVLEKSDA